MSIDYFTREKSLISDADSLEFLYSIKNFPVFIGSTDNNLEDDILFDLTWDICRETGCIQLRNLLDPKIIYSEYHSEALGGVWGKHHKEFQKFSERFLGTDILEIGGSNGVFAESILSNNRDVASYTIVEPNPQRSSSEKISVVQDFFHSGFNVSGGKKFDTIIHSHTFEHAYDPIDFLNGIKNNLIDHGHHVFSIPNLQLYLDKKFSNTLNFEHTFFLSSELAEDLLDKAGFTLLAKHEFQAHSIFYAFYYDGKERDRPFRNFYQTNRASFDRYILHHKNQIQKLNQLIDQHEGDVFLFGGHVFSQFLLSLGINQEKIKGILDNSEHKEGKRLYGTPFKIRNPRVLEVAENPAVVLKAGQYQEEIRDQLISICKNCKIFE